MLFGKIDEAGRYDYSEKKFSVAFDFLKRKDLKTLPEGTIELGEGVRASIQRYETIVHEEASFETHDKYFDIQYMIEGNEKVLVCDRNSLIDKTEYNEDSDTTLYLDPECSSEICLSTCSYLILSPEDAHKPRCMISCSAPVRKVVIKIPVR